MNRLEQPWLITPSGFSRVSSEGEKRKALKAGATAIDLVIESPRAMSVIDDNCIAHIYICGVIGHRLDWIDKALGNTDVCDVRRELDEAVAEGAKGIFLRIDSPGGAVTGTCELAEAIAEVSGSIPVFAFGDACIASAAYWLAASARQIWTTASAEIGSIGIYLPWIDKSQAWQALGISFEPFTNTEAIYKSAGHGPSLTPEQREQTQGFIERIYSLFQGFVTQQRPQLDSSAMQGQSFLGCDAPLYGLTDMTGSIQEAYSALCMEAGVFPVDVPLDQFIPISFELARPLGQKKKINGSALDELIADVFDIDDPETWDISFEEREDLSEDDARELAQQRADEARDRSGSGLESDSSTYEAAAFLCRAVAGPGGGERVMCRDDKGRFCSCGSSAAKTKTVVKKSGSKKKAPASKKEKPLPGTNAHTVAKGQDLVKNPHQMDKLIQESAR